MIEIITLVASLITGSPSNSLEAALRADVAIPYHAARGRWVPWRACRESQVGCASRLKALALFFHLAGREHGVDPFLLAAMAFEETRGNPWAEGKGGELGVMQLHRANARGRAMRKRLRDKRERRRCERAWGECQLGVIRAGAETLAAFQARCTAKGMAEDLAGYTGAVALSEALTGYNTGKCHRDDSTYSSRVLRRMHRLKEIATRW